MDTVKVIKTPEEYDAALATIEELIDRNPAQGTADADRLELLALLVEQYEDRSFPLRAADPVEAIRFRMEQQDLSPRDLVPFLGSRAKVSEVLSGNRELTLSMIRALHKGLGIPAEALLASGDSSVLLESKIEWGRFPLREMVKRGWIKGTAAEIKDRAEELVRGFLAPLGPKGLEPALYRKNDHVRVARKLDLHALAAWTARVLLRAHAETTRSAYRHEKIDEDFMRGLVSLSPAEDGPIRARDYLSRHGVALVIEPHLPGTHLDGAAMLDLSGVPVIGMTLRYDRLDNFWFTLLHEVVHVARHLGPSASRFYDDLETDAGEDPREIEADAKAGDLLIPTAAWERSGARIYPAPEAVLELAHELGIHPAIVAGRVQRESKNYKLLHQMVGRGEVRSCFPEVSWKE